MARQNKMIFPAFILGAIGVILLLDGLGIVDLGLGVISTSNWYTSPGVQENSVVTAHIISLYPVHFWSSDSACNQYVSSHGGFGVAKVYYKTYVEPLSAGYYKFASEANSYNSKRSVDCKPIIIYACSGPTADKVGGLGNNPIP